MAWLGLTLLVFLLGYCKKNEVVGGEKRSETGRVFWRSIAAALNCLLEMVSSSEIGMADFLKSSLHEHPDVAQKVGLVVADYAVLEMLAYLIYAVISDEPPAVSFRRFYVLRTINKREELTTEAAKNLEEPLQRAIRIAWRRFKAAANRRTEIAHCTFLSDGEGVSRLRLHGDELRFETISEAVFLRTFVQFQTLGTDLGMLASVLADGRVSIPEIVSQSPLGQIRKEQPALLGSPHHPARYSGDDTKASLMRLKLLDFEVARWKAKGIVPENWDP